MSNQSVSKGNSKGLEEFCERFGRFLLVIFRVLHEGFKKINWKCPITLGLLVIGYSVLFFIIGHGLYFLDFLRWLDPDIFTPFRLQRLANLGQVTHGLWLLLAYWFGMLFICGLRPFKERLEVEKALARLNIKAGLNCLPKVIKLEKFGKHKTKITVLSQGIGVDHYARKIKDIESSFNQIVEGVRQGLQPKFIEITLTSRVLPKLCYHKEMARKIVKPYSFVIGESLDGTQVKSILDFPGGHVMVAGTSGGGKSNFTKALLVSLLKTSANAEFFLYDFKGGTEFMPFKKFPNVSVEKDMKGALRSLRMIQAEMNRRFSILEKIGKPMVVPTREKLNHLFVCIDEASLLYGKVSRSDSDYENVLEARKITGDISKRGRSARISLIFSTQKITKETIPTEIQENLTARMCFRMNTLQGSLVVLGNKLGMELPDTPGRAIWQCGNTQYEVQAPLLNEKDIGVEAQVAAYEYEEEGKRNFFDLLSPETVKKSSPKNEYLESNEVTDKMAA